MKSIKQTYEMKASPEEVFTALTDPTVIEKWSGAPATMDDQTGTEFSLWNGSIHGKNLKVVPNEKLVQDWYSEKWDKPSKATFILESSDEGTLVNLIHENVPDNELDDIDDGWKRYYLGPMKEMFAKQN